MNQNSASAKTDDQVRLVSQHVQSMREDASAGKAQGQSVQQVLEMFIGGIQKLIELVSGILDDLRQGGADVTREMASAVKDFRSIEIDSRLLKDLATILLHGVAELALLTARRELEDPDFMGDEGDFMANEEDFLAKDPFLNWLLSKLEADRESCFEKTDDIVSQYVGARG